MSVEDGKGKRKDFDLGIKVTRRRCESGLLLGAVGWGIYVLVTRWDEKALAGGGCFPSSLICGSGSEANGSQR